MMETLSAHVVIDLPELENKGMQMGSSYEVIMSSY